MVVKTALCCGEDQISDLAGYLGDQGKLGGAVHDDIELLTASSPIC